MYEHNTLKHIDAWNAMKTNIYNRHLVHNIQQSVRTLSSKYQHNCSFLFWGGMCFRYVAVLST